ncbi:MAG: hypothetical protein ABEI75_04070 [Halobaculum sp.]
MRRDAPTPDGGIDRRATQTAAHDGSVAVTGLLAALPVVAIAAASHAFLAAAVAVGVAVGVALS